MQKNIQTIRILALIALGLLVGTIFVFQSKSVAEAERAINRDMRINIFKEIEIVHQSNNDLRDQIEELEQELESIEDKESALENLRNQIEKYSIISGDVSVEGEGIRMIVDKEIEALWFTDIINEFYTAGAEAVMINGIRLTDENVGFDNIPNGKVLFNSVVLEAP
ncbi:DUF881 domain-containing protein, partial [Candidatus Peregrinibacteria bacterium]|nr:DUF881 domain-containing protein [Candidatus Peregrinibacteria bacterium]